MHISELEQLIRLMERNSKCMSDPLGRSYLEADGDRLKMTLGDLMQFLHSYYDPFTQGKISLPKE